jgi:hypothetical protein
MRMGWLDAPSWPSGADAACAAAAASFDFPS